MLILALPCIGYTQLFEDFSDGNITSSPSWHGDLKDFTINDDRQLQLHASNPGNSSLCTGLNSKLSSIRFEIDIFLDFEPSESNKVRLWLMGVDTVTLDTSSYVIEIGQSGTGDPVEFYYTESNHENFLGESFARLRTQDDVHLELIATASGNWWIFSPNNTGVPVRILSITDQSWKSWHPVELCIECSYTSSRTSSFAFDNIIADLLKPDTTPPIIKELLYPSGDTLELIFSETLLDKRDNIAINISPGPLDWIVEDIADNSAIVSLNDLLQNGTSYKASIGGVQDTAGNTTDIQTFEFTYWETKVPEHGDLLVNEVLFDPPEDVSPYIEFLNASDRAVQIADLQIEIGEEGQHDFIAEIPDITLAPDSILVLTSDIHSVTTLYWHNDERLIYEADFPKPNREAGHIIVRAASGRLVDSLPYASSMHSPFLLETTGVALERIATGMATGVWQSAAQHIGWGTPGRENSQIADPVLISSKTPYSIKNRTFSPNGDGVKDYVFVDFNQEAAGRMLQMSIFSLTGYLVTPLVTQQFIGSEYHVAWSGETAGNHLVQPGIYILLIELTDESGKVRQYKEPLVLAAWF